MKIQPLSSAATEPTMLNLPGELPRVPNCRSSPDGDTTKAVKA